MMDRKLVLAVFLLAVLVSQSSLAFFASAQETNNVQTLLLQPVYEVTLSNNAPQVAGGITVGQLYGVSWISYLTFNITSLPNDASIQSINLKVKSDTFTSGNRWVNAYSVSSNWTESTVNWDNRPTQGTFIATQWIDLYNEWYTWDCSYTTLETQNGNLSISLELLSGTDGYLTFYSMQSSYPAQLEIKYTVPEPTPTPTVYSATDVMIGGIVLIGIIAVICIVGYVVFRKIFPKSPKYQLPPSQPNNCLTHKTTNFFKGSKISMNQFL